MIGHRVGRPGMTRAKKQISIAFTAHFFFFFLEIRTLGKGGSEHKSHFNSMSVFHLLYNLQTLSGK